MATSRIGLHVRITPDLRDRIELGRLAGFQSRPLAAPTSQAFIETLLERGLEAHELEQRSVMHLGGGFSFGIGSPESPLDSHASGGGRLSGTAVISTLAMTLGSR